MKLTGPVDVAGWLAFTVSLSVVPERGMPSTKIGRFDETAAPRSRSIVAASITSIM
ncbi:hypothetical protein [Roseinatronobacter sp.]|uniref:hypothetical protein n=1 Tax=Roseinatronobacter sp. TaxID=1945755 RepID=UPI0025D33797|nr:hypothetical protein [Roseibaca sp.]